jgi:hypothetical protein
VISSGFTHSSEQVIAPYLEGASIGGGGCPVRGQNIDVRVRADVADGDIVRTRRRQRLQRPGQAVAVVQENSHSLLRRLMYLSEDDVQSRPQDS